MQRPVPSASAAPPVPLSLDDDRLLDTAQVAAVLNVSVPHLRRLYRSGKVPAPVSISGRKFGWRVGTIRALIRAAEARAA